MNVKEVRVCPKCKSVFWEGEMKCNMCGSETVPVEKSSEYKVVSNALKEIYEMGMTIPEKPKEMVYTDIEVPDLSSRDLGILQSRTTAWIAYLERIMGIADSEAEVSQQVLDIIKNKVMLEADIQSYQNVSDRKARRDSDNRTMKAMKKYEIYNTKRVVLQRLLNGYYAFKELLSREITRRNQEV